MSGYTKLFHSLIHSTIWCEPLHIKVAWVTLLAMTNAEGLAETSCPGLAKAAGIPLEQAEEAIAKFLAPDPHSRDKTDGRRIESVPGGFNVLNHASYNYRMSIDDRRARDAERKRKKRALLKMSADSPQHPQTSADVSAMSHTRRDQDKTNKPPVVPLAGDATAKAPKRTTARRTVIPPDWAPTDEQRTRARQSALDVDREALKFKTHAEATGRLLANWTAGFTTWLLKAAEQGSQGPRNGYGKPPGLVQHENGQRERARAPRVAWLPVAPGQQRE